jgi:hypothetical protein
MGFGPDDEEWPVTLLSSALSFVKVADAAVANLGQVGSATAEGLTILFLLAQSIELALKTFLLMRGSPPSGSDKRDLRNDQKKRTRKIGHDLPTALHAAVSVGFPSPHPSDEKLLKLLSESYAGRRLQYRAPGLRKVPLLRPVRELAQQYLTEVHRAATCTIADPSQVPGLAIDPSADYGSTSLEQFRAYAQNVRDL